MIPSVVIQRNPPPSGLKNCGNTCFFNATLQCLLSIPKFTLYFRNSEFDESKQPVSFAFQKFIIGYWNSKELFNPLPFISSLRRKIKLFDGTQQDAYCFLDGFLTVLSEEDEESKRLIRELFTITGEDSVRCRSCESSKKVGICSMIQYLYIKKNIQESLNNYLESEDVLEKDHYWDCAFCKEKTGASIRHKFVKTSKYLILHLNRFLSITSKANNPVAVDSKIVVNGTAYENIGVVCHVGGLSGGHYFAKSIRNSKWWNFNDSSVSSTSQQFEPSQPYILFYRRKD